MDGHGNFGSVDGDGAAAMRYTEARLSKISKEMLADIAEDTVDFIPNFDETEREPVVLPSRYPNLLANGTSGIAVGMATNIPPHNLREIIAAVVKIIDNQVQENRDTTIEEVMEIIKGPDFPTGAQIVGKRGIESAYRTGRGKLKVRAISDIEQMPNGKSRIIISEIPYMVNKAKLIEKIAELVRDKRVEGITDLRDESNREGMRIVIELRKDINAQVLLNQLYKHTQLQDTFGVIMIALVDGQPKCLNLLEMLQYYLLHQKEVVTRRTKFRLNKAEERAHILEGLMIAIDHIDEVIKIIRGSESVETAKSALMQRFNLSEKQATAIVDMRLRALTGLEHGKLEAEYAELQKKIADYKAILGDENLLLGVIRTEILVIAEKYGDDRRTLISYDEEEINMEDLIPDEDTVVAMTHLGYIKRMTPENFKAQNRGGKGIKGMSTLDEDYIEDLLMTRTHNHMMFFTNLGRVYPLRAFQIPEASRTARGTAIVNIIRLQPGEKVSAIVSMDNATDESMLFFVTKNGIVKKTPLLDFVHIRRNGIQAITLREEDQLIEVKLTDGNKEILMATKYGMCIRFKETEVRPTGRTAMGVIGMELIDGDEVVGMQLNTQGDTVLIVSENGLGKRTPISEFNVQHRGGKGVKCYKITDRTGDVIGIKSVNDDREIMLITSEGIIIRIEVTQISILGRITSGVKLINLDEGVKVATVSKVRVNPEGSDTTGDETVVMDVEDENEDDEEEEKLPKGDGSGLSSDIQELLERAEADAEDDEEEESGDSSEDE